ncbi:MAG: alpha/beta hydrolase [Chloroflexi bacterium]|nr:alpha/beta hydrolase [Chloroflexota bacterium]
MKENYRTAIQLSGEWQYRLRSLINLYWSMLQVSIRRLACGPRLPNWSWGFEVSTHFVRMQTIHAFDMPNHAEGRAYENSLVFGSPAVAKVAIEPVHAPVKGHWFRPKREARDVTVLYLHGGGYAYYSKAHENIIALVTLAAKSRTFALDYRLIPEHPFPAQLDDALAAYRWLLETGVQPDRLAVVGDSAGGNLALGLLLSLRESQLPLPALAICIAPWMDIENSGESMEKNEPYDWVQKRMPLTWAKWLCKDADPRNPTLSPIHADLSGLPPIYIQAGSAEILHDMIRAFADRAQSHNWNVRLDVWQNMNHDFQAFGEMIPESREALARIGQVIEETIK